MHQIGERVIAFQSFKEGVLKLIGYGKYLGDEIPDEKAGGLCQMLREEGIKNPCIVLDSGEKVYGAECWWAPIAQFQDTIGKTDPEIIPVSLEELRS